MSTEHTRVSVHAIILAAGHSRRMGQPKQLLRYRGSTITAHVVRALLNVPVDSVTVVSRSVLLSDLELPDDLRVGVAVNDADNSEMIDSVRLGLAYCGDREASNRTDLSGNDGIMVIPGDMPRITTETYRVCIDTFRQDTSRLIVATYAGRRGHPLILPARLQSDIAGLGGGLNSLLDAHRDNVVLVPTADPGVVDNVNSPEDYARLLSDQ